MPEQSEKNKVNYIQLTRDCALAYHKKILELETNWSEIGDQPWGKDNLLLELPSKWNLSNIALFEGKPVGYQVGSICDVIGHGIHLNGKGNYHQLFLNKILVDKSMRGMGIAKGLLKKFLEQGLKLEKDLVIFKVRTDNPAVAFYDKLEFKKMDELAIRPDGVKSFVYNTEIRKVIKNL